MSSSTSGRSSQHWRTYAASPSAIRLPVGFDVRLDRGECVLVPCRASGHGSRARELAARTAISAVELFHQNSGLDFTSALPSTETIVGLLEAAETEVSRRPEGEVMRHQFVLIDLTDVAPLKLLVSTGTGHHIDETLSQPFIFRTAMEYTRQNACIMTVKNSTRSGRYAAGTATLMSAISTNNGAICDEDGLGVVDLGRNLTSYIRGLNAEEQAKGMTEAVRRAQLTRTGVEMVGGQVQCHTASACPPGFGYAWLQNAGASPVKRVLYLDNDACRPVDDEAAYGLSEVRYPEKHPREGGRVDQVDNVRFVLAHFAKTGWTRQKIINALIERQYSTDQFRSTHGSHSSIKVGAGQSVLTAILDNLDMYESGILTRSVGGGVEPISIAGCIAPDGPWAGPTDFARIRAFLRERNAIRDTFTTLTFSGLRCWLDGVAVVLVSDNGRTRRSRSGQLPYYTFLRSDTYPHTSRAPENNRSLAPMAFAESIVHGLIDAGDIPLEVFNPEDAPTSSDPVLARLRADQARLTIEIDTLERRRDGLLRRLGDTDANGNLVLHGALLIDSQANYNHVVEEELPALRRRLASQCLEIDDIVARQPKSAPADLLLYLVESLRDPTDRKYRALWLSTLRDVQFISSLTTRDELMIKVVTWSGNVVLNNGDAEVVVPFAGRFEYAPKGPLQDPIADSARMAAAAMASGVALRPGSRRVSRLMLPQVAQELGITSEHMLVNGCDDPRILTTATALLRSGGSIEDVVAETGEVDAFVRRIREVHLKQDAERTWQKKESAILVALYALASIKDGVVSVADLMAAVPSTSKGQVYNVFSEHKRTSSRWSSARKKGYHLASCSCGSLAALIMAIPEPVGAVCANCRFDEAGIEWPADPYDRYCAFFDVP